jgi:protein ImuB
MLAILDEAFGHVARPITPRRPLPDYWQEQNFADPIATEDVIRATLKSLTAALAKILERQGKGARRLEAVFFRADGAVRRIAVEMGMPTRDPAVIDRLFREKLAVLTDPLDPGFGFDLIRVCASRVEEMETGVTAFHDAAQDEKEINFLIDRLSARFGANRVSRFEPNGTHIPEDSFHIVPAQIAPASKAEWKKLQAANASPRRPLRMFAQPEPVGMDANARLNWRRANRAITRQEGPERIAMEWWRQERLQAARDYFRIEDEEGRRYWLYRSSDKAQWFLHGMFA